MKKIQGFSLLELFIAILLIAMGVFGSVALQTAAKKNSFDAIQRAQATALAHDIIERMRTNSSQLASYEDDDYGKKTINTIPECMQTSSVSKVRCTPSQLAAYDIYQWDSALKGAQVTDAKGRKVGGLIQPTGCIFIDNARNSTNTADLANVGNVTVVVSWEGRFSFKDADDSLNKSCGVKSKSRRLVAISSYIY
jgi:type IV pilus assembly protein PilV